MVIGGEIVADELVFLTDVEQVALFYGTPKETRLGKVKLAKVEKLFAEGHFPPGSMGPKIEASCDFIRRGGERVMITSFDKFVEAYAYGAGTHIVP